MKVQIEKGALVQVLQKVQSITEKKTNMPILSNTLLKTTDQQMIQFFATDLELSAWTQIAASIATPGTITVTAKKLLEIIRELPQEYIALEEVAGNKLSIHAGRSRFELSTIPAEDFPHMSFHPDANLAVCDPVVLRTALNRTLYGIPAEEDPFSISGLFLHRGESFETGEPNGSGEASQLADVRFVSSDGHRLAYYQIPGSSFPDLNLGNGIVIPRKGVQEIVKALEKETEATIGIQENCLILRTSNTLLSVQLLETEFPEYQLIIPEERPFSFLVDTESLYLALKRVAVLTNQKWRHVRFAITKGVLELEAGDPEVGNASDSVDIEYEGEDFTVAFNIRYVMDTIQAIESPQVRFEWLDAYHGGIFLGSDDPGYFSLIMPMVV
jgi:DNA polymerase-3 subunit beta